MRCHMQHVAKNTRSWCCQKTSFGVKGGWLQCIFLALQNPRKSSYARSSFLARLPSPKKPSSHIMILQVWQIMCIRIICKKDSKCAPHVLGHADHKPPKCSQCAMTMHSYYNITLNWSRAWSTNVRDRGESCEGQWLDLTQMAITWNHQFLTQEDFNHPMHMHIYS